jgi:hypothetical protein
MAISTELGDLDGEAVLVIANGVSCSGCDNGIFFHDLLLKEMATAVSCPLVGSEPYTTIHIRCPFFMGFFNQQASPPLD